MKMKEIGPGVPRPLGSANGLFESMIIEIKGLVTVTLNCREMTWYELNGDCLFRYFTEVDDIDKTSLLLLVGDNQRRYTFKPTEPPGFTQTLLPFSEQNVQMLTICRKHLHTSVHGITDEQMTTPICDNTTRADFLFHLTDTSGDAPFHVLCVRIVRSDSAVDSLIKRRRKVRRNKKRLVSFSNVAHVAQEVLLRLRVTCFRFGRDRSAVQITDFGSFVTSTNKSVEGDATHMRAGQCGETEQLWTTWSNIFAS